MHEINQGLVFPIEHEMINILLFKRCIVVIPASLLHHCGTKVALDIMKITSGCVLIKLYLQRQVRNQI